MTTPTPASKHPAATSGIGATPPVSTPFSASKSINLSPQAYKKSPANSHPYGHPSTSSFGALNFDSPTTAAALATLPLADLGMDGPGGGLGMAGLAGMGVRLGEDERKRKRFAQVLEILQGVKGRVSEEGIERLARRVGLECLWESGLGAGGGKTLIIAGTGVSIDIDFVGGWVEKVTLSFPESAEMVTRHAEGAGGILLRDLRDGMRAGLGERNGIERFAGNLERLATLDKLSVTPQLNCHEAVAGVYESLKRLYDWEVARIREELGMVGKCDAQIERAVLCGKSGRAIMNAHGNVGFSLDYWQDGHAAPGKAEGDPELGEKTWSLLIECAPSSSLVYPSIRVSTTWISPSIAKTDPTPDDLLLSSGPVLDWQDPPNILLPADSDAKDENAMEGIEQSGQPNQKFPDVRFVAKFAPPLVLPFNVAVQVFNSTGAQLEQEHGLATWDALVFPVKGAERSEVDGAYRRIRREQEVTVYSGDGQKEKRVHANTLTVPKMEYARTLTEVPFSHPRELVDMLPILRQYARLSILLESSFGSGTREDKSEEEDQRGEDETVKDEFEAFMAEAASKQAPKYTKLPVDVALYTQPLPRVRVNFAIGNRTANLWVEVGGNGTLAIVSQNILDEDSKLKTEDLGRILEICGDIGVFVEFLRMKLQ